MTSGAGDGSEDGSEKNVKKENVDSAKLAAEVRNDYFSRKGFSQLVSLLSEIFEFKGILVEIPEIP